jgi:hypothetical protein
MTETATVKHPPNKNYTDPPLIFFQQLYCTKCGVDTTIDATVKFLVTLAETSNLPVFVAVRKTNGEFTVFSHGFRVTRKNRVAEGVVF